MTLERDLLQVLVTNDDGDGAEGMEVLIEALHSEGLGVTVVAPEENHTAGSHRISFGQLSLRRRAPGRYVCSGTPADCVRVGLLSGDAIGPPPQIVVSGVNHGANAGEDVHYSGTVAAAAEAALLGAPAIAVSQDGDGPSVPFLARTPEAFADLAIVARLARWCATNGMPVSAFASINLPLTIERPGLVPARVGRRRWEDARVHLVDIGPQTWDVDPWHTEPDMVPEPQSDFAALAQGRASISLIGVRAGMVDLFDAHANWLAQAADAAQTSQS